MKLYEWHKSTEKPDESCECLILLYNDRIFVGEFSTTPHVVFNRYFTEPEFYYNNDFDGNIYGKVIHVKFIQYLRDEEKYEYISDLIDQIEKDKDDARRILKNGI